jgi:hypothetical protein
MYLEYDEITIRHSWPDSTDMTRSDTYPVHVDFSLTTAELTALSKTACEQLINIEGVAA